MFGRNQSPRRIVAIISRDRRFPAPEATNQEHTPRRLKPCVVLDRNRHAASEMKARGVNGERGLTRDHQSPISGGTGPLSPHPAVTPSVLSPWRNPICTSAISRCCRCPLTRQQPAHRGRYTPTRHPRFFSTQSLLLLRRLPPEGLYWVAIEAAWKSETLRVIIDRYR